MFGLNGPINEPLDAFGCLSVYHGSGIHFSILAFHHSSCFLPHVNISFLGKPSSKAPLLELAPHPPLSKSRVSLGPQDSWSGIGGEVDLLCYVCPTLYPGLPAIQSLNVVGAQRTWVWGGRMRP